MTTPLPPIVVGPILPSSTSVQVTGTLQGADVRVESAGSMVGQTTAPANGAVWVPLNRALNIGESIVAKQMLNGVDSLPSNQPIAVVGLPSPLPAPAFGSPLTECMDLILLNGLVPGAKVSVTVPAGLLASFVSPGSSSWAQLDPAVAINSGDVLSVTQAVAGKTSPTTQSPRLASVSGREGLGSPQVNQPLFACDTAALVSGLIPAGALELQNAGHSDKWCSIAPSFWAVGIQPLTAGKLRARQSLPRCGGQSDWAEIPVGPATAPPAPMIQTFCPDTKRVVVSGLKPGGVLTLYKMEFNTQIETELGSIGIGSTIEQVDLPEVVGGSGPYMNVVARQTLCGLTSPPGNAAEIARPGSGALPPKVPKVIGPLFDCARAVPGEDLLGVLTQVYSTRTGAPLSDPVVPLVTKARLPVWFPLVANDAVEIRQIGCSAPSPSASEPVKPLPAQLPPPVIVEPVRPGARSVRVTKYLPGSRVHLLIDSNEAMSTDATWIDPTEIPVVVPLKEGQHLWAFQTLCTAMSTPEGHYTVVKRGNLDLTVTPDVVPGGKSVPLTVTAKDHDTGDMVPGLPVLIAGSQGGVTGATFSLATPTTGTTISGTVKGGEAHFDAGFSLAIKQGTPVTLNLFPGPVVIPNKVVLSDIVWTLTPRWSGSTPITLSQNVGTVLVPPAAGANPKVGVALKCTASLAGEINGIDWPRDDIKLDGPICELALIAPTHAVSALFTYGTQDVPVTDSDGNVTGYETRLYALINLFSIT